jgi:uncharacterized protein (TIGR02597 family)
METRDFRNRIARPSGAFCLDIRSSFRNSGGHFLFIEPGCPPSSPMKPLCSPLPLLAALALAPLVHAQNEAVTDPVGFVSVTVPAQSDAVLAVPLYRTAAFRGIIQSISGNTITVSGTPNWTTNQYVQNIGTQNDTFAVVIASGAKEGLTGRVTANGAGTVTLQLDAGEDLTGIGTVAVPVDPDGAGPKTAQADQVDILPYWTPQTLITGVPIGTEFLGFEGTGAGVNLAAVQLLGFTGSGWEDQITSNDASHKPLNFGAGFVLRNNSGSPVTISMVGAVPMSSHRMRFRTLAGGVDQDVRFGYLSPVPEAVVSLQIPAVAGDAILGFNNAAQGKNKSASTIYAFDGAQWVDDITGEPLNANVMLQPGFGYIYRKYRTASPQTSTWQHLQSYLQ